MVGIRALSDRIRTAMTEGLRSDEVLVAPNPFHENPATFSSPLVGRVATASKAKSRAGILDTREGPGPARWADMKKLAMALLQYRERFPDIETADMRRLMESQSMAGKDYLGERVILPMRGADVEAGARARAAKMFPSIYNEVDGWDAAAVHGAMILARGFHQDTYTGGGAEFQRWHTTRIDEVNRKYNAARQREIMANAISRVGDTDFRDYLATLKQKAPDVKAWLVERITQEGERVQVQEELVVPGDERLVINIGALTHLETRHPDKHVAMVAELRRTVEELGAQHIPIMLFKEFERGRDSFARTIIEGDPYVPREFTDEVQEARRAYAPVREMAENAERRAVEVVGRIEAKLNAARAAGDLNGAATLEISLEGARAGLKYYSDYLTMTFKEQQEERRAKTVSGFTTSASRPSTVKHRSTIEPVSLERLAEEGHSPEGNVLLHKQDILEVWKDYIQSVSEIMPMALVEARAREMAMKFPTRIQRDEALRLIRNGVGDPIRGLTLSLGVGKWGVDVDVGETRTLERVNAVRALFRKKPYRTYDEIRQWAENDGLLAVLRFLTNPGTIVNNLASAYRNTFVITGSGPFGTESGDSRVKNMVRDILPHGNAKGAGTSKLT